MFLSKKKLLCGLVRFRLKRAAKVAYLISLFQKLTHFFSWSAFVKTSKKLLSCSLRQYLQSVPFKRAAKVLLSQMKSQDFFNFLFESSNSCLRFSTPSALRIGSAKVQLWCWFSKPASLFFRSMKLLFSQLRYYRTAYQPVIASFIFLKKAPC